MTRNLEAERPPTLRPFDIVHSLNTGLTGHPQRFGVLKFIGRYPYLKSHIRYDDEEYDLSLETGLLRTLRSENSPKMAGVTSALQITDADGNYIHRLIMVRSTVPLLDTSGMQIVRHGEEYVSAAYSSFVEIDVTQLMVQLRTGEGITPIRTMLKTLDTRPFEEQQMLRDWYTDNPLGVETLDSLIQSAGRPQGSRSSLDVDTLW